MKLWLCCMIDAEGSDGNKIKGTPRIVAEEIVVLATKPNRCSEQRDPRWTPENRPVVDGSKPASERAAPSTSVVPQSLVIEQASHVGMVDAD
jgi:hypothetical protein